MREDSGRLDDSCSGISSYGAPPRDSATLFIWQSTFRRNLLGVPSREQWELIIGSLTHWLPASRLSALGSNVTFSCEAFPDPPSW